MKLFKAEIEGETTEDILDALKIIQQQVEDGFVSGFDGNETGRYNFTVYVEER